MTTKPRDYHIYEGTGDDLAEQVDVGNRIILLPDAPIAQRDADPLEHIRLMWGQRLIDDLLAGRYRALVCAVNARDNSHGIINLLAERLPTSQWHGQAITEYARHFVQKQSMTVVKYDMDRVKVLGPGEAYYFESRTPHRFRNVGTEPAIIVSANTPATF